MSSRAIPYSYQSLSKDPDEIRLLWLLPASSPGGVEIEIINVLFSAPSAYEALSYAWGSSERPYRATVRTSSETPHGTQLNQSFSDEEGVSVQPAQSSYLAISHNLSIALQHLTLSEQPRCLWIDAICINQDDILERSEQVKKMASIYGKAQQVILWLGEESDQSTLAFKTLSDLGNGIDILHWGEATISHPKSDGLASMLEKDNLAMAEMAPRWLAIGKLLRRAWLTRLWVLQEMALSTKGIFMAGAAVLPLPIFQAAIYWIYRMYDNSATLPQFLDYKQLEQVISMNLCTSGSSGLLALTMLTRFSNCLDPRDRIYAILSLLSPELSAAVVPDYSRAPEDIFKDTVLLGISLQGHLNILTICRFHDPASVLSLPSWVFDFSLPFQLSMIGLNGSNASRLSKQQSIYDPSDNSLTIYGCRICAVDQITEAVPLDATVPEVLAICRSWEEAAHPVSQGSEDSWMLYFITTIFSLSISGALHLGSTLDMHELRDIYEIACQRGSFPPLGSNSSVTSSFARNIQRDLGGHRLFKTDSGLMGLCPSWASNADIIIVAFGCDSPLILRRTERNRYQIGGKCSVNGKMLGEGFLGPLSTGCRIAYMDVAGDPQAVFVNAKGLPTQFDPRAGPLPSGWSVWYGADCQSKIEVENGKLKEQWFFHEETEKWTQYDPRLTPENLKSMGVDIEEFVLI